MVFPPGISSLRGRRGFAVALEAAQQLLPGATALAQLVLRGLREVLGAEGLVHLGRGTMDTARHNGHIRGIFGISTILKDDICR